MSLFSSINQTSSLPFGHTYNNSGYLGAFVDPHRNNCSCSTCGIYRKEQAVYPPTINHTPNTYWSQSYLIHSNRSSSPTDSDSTTSTSSSDHIAIQVTLAPPPPPHRSSVESDTPLRLAELKDKAISSVGFLRMALLDKQDNLCFESTTNNSKLKNLNAKWETIDVKLNKLNQVLKLLESLDDDEYDV